MTLPGGARASRATAALLGLFVVAGESAAQHAHAAADSTPRLTLGAMAIGVYSRVSPGALEPRVSEAYLTQPMAMASARTRNGRWQGYLTINAEGATLDRGEINPGVYGEGYVDRRHPHTWLHEAMAGVRQPVGTGSVALFAGKGFVPYGTDDPMVRPFVKYPANHHHAQVMERAMVAVGARVGVAAIEAASFNGDEPESPSDWPNEDRLFDSWALRGTVDVRPDVELSGSLAHVRSPEFAPGDGLDQRKRSMALRVTRPSHWWRYALVEGARTLEFSSGRQVFDFSTLLAETEVATGTFLLAGRIERTTRPEEERTHTPYRSRRPLLDFNILGRTRWTNTTVAVSHAGWGRGRLMGRPFVEVGYHVPRATRHPTSLDPVELFNSDHIWSFSMGLRLHAGQMRTRFGRYGIDR